MNLILPAIGAGVGLLSSGGGTWRGSKSPAAVRAAIIGAFAGLALTSIARGGITQHMDQLKYIIPGYQRSTFPTRKAPRLPMFPRASLTNPKATPLDRKPYHISKTRRLAGMGPQFDAFGNPDRVHY